MNKRFFFDHKLSLTCQRGMELHSTSKRDFQKKSKVGYKKMTVDLGMSKLQPLSESRMGKECKE